MINLILLYNNFTSLAPLKNLKMRRNFENFDPRIPKKRRSSVLKISRSKKSEHTGDAAWSGEKNILPNAKSVRPHMLDWPLNSFRLKILQPNPCTLKQNSWVWTWRIGNVGTEAKKHIQQNTTALRAKFYLRPLSEFPALKWDFQNFSAINCVADLLDFRQAMSKLLKCKWWKVIFQEACGGPTIVIRPGSSPEDLCGQ